MKVKSGWTRVLVVVAASLTAGCWHGPPEGGDWPGVDTAEETIGATHYRLKLDGTVHFNASPVHLNVTARAASPAAPRVTRVEVVLTQAGAADPVARATYAARWVAAEGRWEVDIQNVFPRPEPEQKYGRDFRAGTYLLRVDLYEGDQAVGRLGPLEVYLGFRRTRD
jgi:hypothetical protein